MIDFDALVLGPCMNIFARPITVYPLASKPGGEPYAAQGIYNSRDVDIAMDEGILVSQVVSLGIRFADFTDPVSGLTVPPMQRDEIVLVGDRVGPIRFAVKDPPRRDGQGGANLILASITAPPPKP